MNLPKLLLIPLLAASLSAAQASIIVSKDLSSTSSISGLTGFASTGADMDGLLITASFANGFSQTLAWADTGLTSGGVSGSGWGLNLSGDTFSSLWNFSFTSTSLGQLLGLTLDATGPGQITVLDATNPSTGSAGSARGKDFSVAAGCAGCNGTAVYSHAIGISPTLPVEDIFHKLSVNFDRGAGPVDSWSFFQDTDNDIIYRTPEPSSLGLVGVALIGLGALSRRTRT